MDVAAVVHISLALFLTLCGWCASRPRCVCPVWEWRGLRRVSVASTRNLPREAHKHNKRDPLAASLEMLLRTTAMLFTSAAAYSAPALRAPQRAAIVGMRRAYARMVDNDQGVEYAVKKSVDEWKSELNDAEYYVLREKGTERPGTGEYNKFYPKSGHFVCAGCGTPLYSAESKFDSGCGWPAFDKIVEGSVVTQTDRSLGMTRVEIMCAGCGGHLGHVFEGEGFTPTMERHCVNSLSVKYKEGPLPDGASEAKVLPPREDKPNPASSILEQLLGKKD